MGGGDQAHIHVNGPVASQALEFPLLDGAQELGLELQWQVTHFVQEQRALVGQFEPSDLLLDGAGECSALVAEQLALQQSQGDG